MDGMIQRDGQPSGDALCANRLGDRPMTSIRGILPALLSNAPTAEGTSGRMQRYASTLQSTPDRWVAVPTPTHNVSLPFRRGGFASLSEALDYAARGETGFNFFDARGRLLTSLPYRQLRIEAQAFARRLIGAGIQPGERLVLIADTWPGFCIAFFGAQYAGIVPVPVPVPVGLGAKAHYVFQLRKQITASQAVGVVAPDELVEFAQSAAEGTAARFAGGVSVFGVLPEPQVELRPLGAGMPCYVQFSSGSTRAPLGVDIRQDQLMANIDGSIAAQRLDANDSGVSWLPLYHDMGLIGFILAPMCAQRSVDLLAPRDFARRPMQWLSLISRRRATITFSPSFGYDLLARRAQTVPVGELDLSSLRLAGVGADMIQLPVLQRFAESFKAAGFDERAFMPSYGMAEVCVGLSFGAPFGGVKVDSFTDPQSGRLRDFVVCGKVMAGHSVEIRDEDGTPLGERHVGRLFVRGPSVMPGYFQKSEESARVLRDGWLDTGDLGYWHKGELVITGRAKDLIIVNGRNIWPQDIEWAVEALPQVGRGDACAFSVDGDTAEAIVVIVQAYPSEPAEREALVGDVKQAVKEAVGVDTLVVLIKRNPGLPRTSSGKLSRTHAKSKFAAGDYST
jgi:fatty-acyl-CoA synthase